MLAHFVEARSGMTEDNPNSKVYGANMLTPWTLPSGNGSLSVADLHWQVNHKKTDFWRGWFGLLNISSNMESVFPKRTKRISHLPYVNNFLYPCFNEVERGYTGFTSSVRPSGRLAVWSSVCGQNVACSVSSTILAWSLSYLHILSNNFRRCVACKDYCMFPNLIFWHFFFFCNFDFVLYDMGSDMNP